MQAAQALSPLYTSPTVAHLTPEKVLAGGHTSHCISFIAVAKACARQKQFKEGRVCLGSRFEVQGHHGREGMAAGACGSWSHCYSQEAER